MGFLVFVIMGGIFFIAVKWVLAKFTGTHVHGRFGAKEALQQQLNHEEELNKLTEAYPEIVEQAILQCKKKGYVLTHLNVLSEASKIIDEIIGAPSTIDKLSDDIKSIYSKFKFNNSMTKIEKLEKLNNLRKEGALSNTEFEVLKTEILK